MNNRYTSRGKRKDNIEWVEGVAIFADNKAFILNNAKVEFITGFNENRLNFVLVEVIPETVCRCTELKDKNGKLIFEGDIVKDTQSGICYFIKWFSEYACYSLANKDGEMNFGCDELEMFLDDLEVIGNIHDNDLLEVER